MAPSPSRFTLLTRHFLRRLLDNDLLSPNGDAHVGPSHVIAMVATPGLLAVALVLLKYGLLWRVDWDRIVAMSVDDGLLYVSMSMIVLGIAATFTWDAFFLDTRDRNILTVLPVSERLLSAAKLASLGLFLSVFVVAANLVPAVFVPAFMVIPLADGTAAARVPALVLAQIAAPCLAGAWSVLVVVSLRGLLALVLPPGIFRRVGPFVQGLLMLGFLGWAISLSAFLDAAAAVAVEGSGPAWSVLPPLWFLGLYEAIIGNPHPVYAALARTALVATASVVVIVLVAFFAPGRQPGAHAMTATGGGRGVMRALRRIAGRLAVADQRARATFVFTMITTGRSARHRLYLAGAAGAGLAWAATGLMLQFTRAGRAAFGTLIPSVPALQVQLVLTLFVVLAIRLGVRIPATLPANWLFRVTERRPVGLYFAGARRAALVIGLLPVAGFIPVSAVLWDWQIAASHALTGALYAAFIVELLFHGFAGIPCATPYVSGDLKLKSLGALYLPGALVLTVVPSWVEHLAFRGAISGLVLPVSLAALAVILSISRRARERALPGLVFDDSSAEAFQTLGLSQ